MRVSGFMFAPIPWEMIMATTTRSTIVGVFDDRVRAQKAVEELRRAGFWEDQVGVLARDDDEYRSATTADEITTKWQEGAVAGALTGAGVGGLWALGIAA